MLVRGIHGGPLLQQRFRGDRESDVLGRELHVRDLLRLAGNDCDKPFVPAHLQHELRPLADAVLEEVVRVLTLNSSGLDDYGDANADKENKTVSKKKGLAGWFGGKKKNEEEPEDKPVETVLPGVKVESNADLRKVDRRWVRVPGPGGAGRFIPETEAASVCVQALDGEQATFTERVVYGLLLMLSRRAENVGAGCPIIARLLSVARPSDGYANTPTSSVLSLTRTVAREA